MGKRKIILICCLVIFLFWPFSLDATEFQVITIKQAGDLPEEFCRVWKKGDFLISDGDNLALIGGTPRNLKTSLTYFPTANAMGSIISFVPEGKNLRSELNIGSPYIRIRNRKEYITYTSIGQVKGKNTEDTITFKTSALHQIGKGHKALIETTYDFIPHAGRINITSRIENTGRIEFEELDYSLYFNPNHRYHFSPFHSTKHPDLNFKIYQKKGYYLGWLRLSSVGNETELEPGNLAPGEAFEVNHVLLVDTHYDRLLRVIYQILRIKPEEAVIQFKDFDGDLVEVIVQDALTSSVFFSSFLKDPHLLHIPLPKGVYSVTANFFPAVVEKLMVVGEENENICVLHDPPKGFLKVKIRNSKDKYVPGKVTFIGLDPTKSPYFKPESPIDEGKPWEIFKNSCYPPEEGLKVELHVGTYLIYSSRGPEYSLDQRVLEILENRQQKLVFRIDKLIDIENLISVDPHMHTRNSDGRISIPERLKSVVAEGVDVAVATDHNYITDYYPTLKRLGLNKYLATIIGSEVSTPGLIHYNIYSLTSRENEENNGAISPVAEEVSLLFERSRKKDPEAIIQVNHPRAGIIGRTGTIGYFNNYKLDQESASFARNNFDTSFDVMEVMNGPCLYRAGNDVAIEDWLHLLNRGYYFPLIGCSDSHLTDKKEPGYSRTYVLYGGKKGDDLDWPLLAEAIKRGRSFTSNGPIVSFKINERYTSGDVFTAREEKINVWLKVQSVPWVTVDEVRIIINGERKIVFPLQNSKNSILKMEEEISLKLKQDSYIAIEVFGKNSLYPVLQAANRGLRNATFPYALTNPVFVDVDGNGRFDAPLPKRIESYPDTR